MIQVCVHIVTCMYRICWTRLCQLHRSRSAVNTGPSAIPKDSSY